jgi:hypothetical protein
VGTEIRTFYSLKEMNDSLTDQLNEYKALSEDYSQWLGSLLRSFQQNGTNGDWGKKSTALQKNARAPMKKNPDNKQLGKMKEEGKSRKGETSCWVQTGEILLCSTEEGEAEILFEAIEEINTKIQALDKFKTTLQQLERLGLGKNVNYITYIKDDVPVKIVLRNKSGTQVAENFKFAADFTAQGILSEGAENLE